jgi:hypothetical protein
LFPAALLTRTISEDSLGAIAKQLCQLSEHHDQTRPHQVLLCNIIGESTAFASLCCTLTPGFLYGSIVSTGSKNHYLFMALVELLFFIALSLAGHEDWLLFKSLGISSLYPFPIVLFSTATATADSHLVSVSIVL